MSLDAGFAIDDAQSLGGNDDQFFLKRLVKDFFISFTNYSQVAAKMAGNRLWFLPICKLFVFNRLIVSNVGMHTRRAISFIFFPNAGKDCNTEVRMISGLEIQKRLGVESPPRRFSILFNLFITQSLIQLDRWP